jgi:DNA (cytosine-5)-methyltransferase 1
VELFSGLGGLSQGFIQAGFDLALAADIHQPSVMSMQRNHPNASTILGDLRRVSEQALIDALEGQDVDVLMAGVPCQGFSLSNRKRTDDDERNQLFKEFLRFACAVQPKAVLIENVSGMRSAKGGMFVQEIQQAIRSGLGMDVHLAFLNAADFGVPQSRERLFFVGLPPGSHFEPPEASHGPRGLQAFRTVRDAIGDLPPLGPGETKHKYGKAKASEYAELLRGDQEELLNHRAPNHPQETIDRIGRTVPGQPMYESFRQRIRLSWDDPSPTQVSGGIRAQFQFGHPSQARGLSIRERCRIQSFPDHIHVEGGLVQGRIQTGNAVPPILAESVATQVLRSLDVL